MTLLLVGIFLTELVKYGIWFRGIQGLQFKRLWLGGILAGIYLVLILVGVVNGKTLLIIWSVVTVVICGFIIKCDNVLITIIQAAFIINCVDEILSSVIRLLPGVSWDTQDELKNYYFIKNVIIIFIFVIVGIIIRKREYLSKEKSIIKFNRGLMYCAIAIMGASLLFVVTGFRDVLNFVGSEKIGRFSRIISIFSFTCLVCLVMIVTYILNENKMYKKYLEKDTLLLKAQKSTYEAMIKKNEEIRCFRHDIQNHFMCIVELIEQGESDKVRSYVEEINGKITNGKKGNYVVGNSVIDAVINYYVSMLDEDVKVEIEGVCSENIKMSDVELCTVVSNIIQNAIEALAALTEGERRLFVGFQKAKGYVQMQVLNSCKNATIVFDITNGIPKTIKTEKNDHGIGLRSAKETLERRGGMFSIEIDDNEFSVLLMIPSDIY